jgi:hypothetical protein
VTTPEMPFGYSILQDPDVADDFIKDVGRLMKRNAEFYGMLTRAENLGSDMYELLRRGHRDAAIKLWEAAHGEPCS